MATEAPPQPAQQGAAPPCKKNMWGLPTSCADNVMPHHRPAMPSLEALRGSPHWPVMLTPDPATCSSVSYDGSSDPARELPINGPAFEIDSAIMKGKMMVHIRNVATTDAAVFDGKRRSIHVAMQVRYKRRVSAADITMGGEFHAPPGLSSAQGARLAWVADKLLHVCARMLSRTADVHIGDVTWYSMPALTACQLVNVSRPGEEPAIWEATEDCRLLSPELADSSGAPLPAERRRKWCDNKERLAGMAFDPEHVHTMHGWLNLVDYPSYMATVAGFPAFDLTRIVSSQPAQIMVKHAPSDEYMLGILIWSERLLYPSEYAAEMKRRKAAARAAAGGGGGGGWLSELLHRHR